MSTKNTSAGTADALNQKINEAIKRIEATGGSSKLRPFYIPRVVPQFCVDNFDHTTAWVSVTEARSECFMARSPGIAYTYGSGRGIRTYTSVEYSKYVQGIQDLSNYSILKTAFNVCFLNKYDNDKQQLGWHADDSPGMDHDHPIAVLSFGQPREIWWRSNDQKGVIPLDQRQLLDNGSLFLMPPGMQRTHQHRIPKGDREMGMRISLTFRHYIG